MTVEINKSLVSSIVGGRHNKPLGGERRSFVQQAADRERGREELIPSESPEKTKDNEAIATTDADSSEGAAQHAPLNGARADLRDETECDDQERVGSVKDLEIRSQVPTGHKSPSARKGPKVTTSCMLPESCLAWLDRQWLERKMKDRSATRSAIVEDLLAAKMGRLDSKVDSWTEIRSNPASEPTVRINLKIDSKLHSKAEKGIFNQKIKAKHGTAMRSNMSVTALVSTAVRDAME